MVVAKPLSSFKKTFVNDVCCFFKKQGISCFLKEANEGFELKYEKTDKDDCVLIENFSKFLSC